MLRMQFLHILKQFLQILKVRIDQAKLQQNGVWHRCHDYRPDGAPAVLEHGKQSAGNGSHQRHTVENANNHATHTVSVDILSIDISLYIYYCVFRRCKSSKFLMFFKKNNYFCSQLKGSEI